MLDERQRRSASPEPVPSARFVLSSWVWTPIGIIAAAWAAYLTYLVTGEMIGLAVAFERLAGSAMGKDWLLLIPGKIVVLLVDWAEHAFGNRIRALNIAFDIVVNLIIGVVLFAASLLLFGAYKSAEALLGAPARTGKPLSGARAVAWRTLAAAGTFVAAIYLLPKLYDLLGDDVVQRRLGFIWAGVVLLACLLLLRVLTLTLPKRVRASAGGTAIGPYVSLQRLHDDYVKGYDRPNEAGILLFDGVMERGRVPAGRSDDLKPNSRLGVAARQFVKKTASTLSLSNDEVEAVERFLLSVGRNELPDGAAGERRGANAFFEEPLTDLHYRVIAETAHITQDEGGVTLVICPESSVRSVITALWQAFSPHCSDITQTWWTPDSGDFDPRQVYSLLVVTDEGLQDRILGERAADFNRVLERLRLIVMIDAHRFDPSLLRLHLALLWTRAPAERVRVIAQGAPRHEAHNLYDTLFGATDRLFEPFSLRSRGKARVFTTVWNSSRSARDSLIERYEPAFQGKTSERHGIELVPLLLVPTLRQSFKAAHFDPWEFKNRTVWQTLPQRLATVNTMESTDVEMRLTHVPTIQQPVFGREPLVALIEDRFNLHDVLGQLYRAQLPPDLLVLAVSHNYPLRDFLVDGDRLTHVLSGGAALLFRPIAPIPHGGLRELALVVLMRVLTQPSIGGGNRGGVSRTEVTTYFDAIANRALLRAFRISPTKRGIEQLFHSQFPGEEFEIEVATGHVDEIDEPSLAAQTVPFDDERYVCRSHRRISESLASFLPLVGKGVAPRRIGWLPRDDHGLAYAENTAVLVQGKYYKVDEVEDNHVIVESLTDPDGHFHVQGGVAFRFWRLYRVPFGDQRVVVADEPDTSENGGIRSIHAAVLLPLERATIGYHVQDTLELPPGQGAAVMEVPIVPAAYIRREHPSVNSTIIRYEVLDNAAVSIGDLSRTAFTLAMVLNDVITALFPGLGHRIAVLSPQAGPALEQLRQTPEGRAAALRYPRLVSERPQFQWQPPPSSEVMETAITDLLVSNFHDGVLPTGSGESRIDLIIVEDWPSDLGVARAIYQYRARIERAAAEFLTWLSTNRERETLYYRFGGSEMLPLFDFEAAAQLMRAVTGNRARE